MALDNKSVVVGTTPTKLCQFDTQVTITNGAAIIALGGPNVTTTTGPTVAASGTIQIRGKGTLYAVCGTSSTVSILSS